MRHLLVLIYILSFFSFVYGKGGAEYMKKGEILQKEYHSVVNYTNEDGHLIVEVNINDKVYRFMFDTGAPCAISENLFHQLNPKVVGTFPVRDQSGLKDSLLFVNLENLRVGNIDFIHTVALVIKDTIFSDCFKYDGIIGSNMLRKSIVQISAEDETITFTNQKNSFHLNKKHSTKLMLDKQSNPYIWLDYGNKVRDMVLFDTGFRDGVYDISLRSLHFFESKSRMDIFDYVLSDFGGNNSYGLHGIGEDTVQYMLGIPEFKLANTSFENATICSTSGISKVGTRFLMHGLVTIDYKNKKFYFEADSSKYNLSEKVLGFNPVYKDGALRVGPIWDISLKGILEKGDEILRINQENYEKIDLCELLNKPNHGDKLHVVLRDVNGNIKEVDLEKKNFTR